MAATVQQIETAILTKLRAAIPALSIEPYPENPAEYELLHPLGAVLVQYDGTSFSGNRIGNGAVAKVRTVRFAIVYIMRNLRSEAGCYEMLDRGQDALCGLCIPGTLSPLEITAEGFTAEHDGVWMYTQMYETTARSVHAPHT